MPEEITDEEKELNAHEFFRKIFADIEGMMNSIPEDKDCKKCIHASNGHSRGMVTPCFDYCEGENGGGIYIPGQEEW